MMPILQQIDPDVVYTQTMVVPWGACAAALLDRPHYWSVCEFGELDHEFTFLDPFAEVINQVTAGASFIRTPSDAVRTTLFNDLGTDRVRTVYPPIFMPSRVKPSPGDFRRVGAKRLAVFGTLCEGKGQLDAVQAIAELIALGRDVELLLAGHSNPAYQNKLEALIDRCGLQDRVRISGFLPEPYPTMLAADIILICSRNEAFGRVAVEGMKLSRPVVYSNSGGIPEYMKDGVTGLSYSPGDVNELVQRIEELIDQPERASQIGAEAKRYACDKFTSTVGEIFLILNELQRSRGRTNWRVAMPKRVVDSLASLAVQGVKDITDAQTQLKSEIAVKDRHILELQKEVEDRSAWGQKLDGEIAVKDRHILELQKEGEDRSAWAQKLDEEIAVKDRRVLELQKEVEDRSAWAQKLDEEIAVKDRRMLELQNSSSWRITAPLRSIRSLLKKFRLT